MKPIPKVNNFNHPSRTNKFNSYNSQTVQLSQTRARSAKLSSHSHLRRK